MISASVGAVKTPPVRDPSTQRHQRCPTADLKASGRSQHLCDTSPKSVRRLKGRPPCTPIFPNQGSPRLCAKLDGLKYLRGTNQETEQPLSMLPGGL